MRVQMMIFEIEMQQDMRRWSNSKLSLKKQRK